MNDQDPVALSATPDQQDDRVALTDPTNTTPVDPDVANLRSIKAHYGLNPQYTNWKPEQIKQAMTEGQEDPFRKMVSQQKDALRNWKLQQDVKGLTLPGQNPNPAVIQALIQSQQQQTDPDTVIEKEYADRYMAGMDEAATKNDTLLKQAEAHDPEGYETVRRLGRDMLVYREYALRGAQEAQQIYDKQSYFGWGVDQAKSLFPFYTDLKMRGSTPGVGYLNGGPLGSHIEEEIQDALTRPFPEFRAWFDSRMQPLMKDNPSLGLTFANAVLDRSGNNRILTNLTTTGADLASLPVGGVAKFAARKWLGAATNDMLRSAASGEPLRVARAAGAGDLSEAAVQKTAADVSADLKGTPRSVEDRAVEALQDGFNTMKKGYPTNPGRFGQEIVNRLIEDATTSSVNIFDRIKNMLKVDRTPELTEQIAAESTIRTLLETTQDTYRGLRNSILNITKPELNEVTNTYHYDVIFGNSKGEYFFNPGIAKSFARVNGLADAVVERDGAGQGWYVKVNRPVDEAHPFIRDLFQTTPASETPSRGLNAWFNAIVGKYRTPEETLSLNQRENRKIATYGPAQLLRLAHDEISQIKELKSWAVPGSKKYQKWQDWKNTIERARDMRDENGDKGYFFKSPGELEDHYLKYVRDGEGNPRMPDPQEIRAYFAYVRFVEMDRSLRNILQFKHKSRLGVQTHRFNLLNDEGQKVFSEWFDGVIHNEMPRNDAQVLVAVGKDKGTEYVKWADQFNTKIRQSLEEGIKNGQYKVVELWDPETRPLNNFSQKLTKENPRVRYVITDKLSSKGIAWDQVPRRGGGHFDYEAEHYIKQARITPFLRNKRVFKHIYEGDTTAFAIAHHAMGEQLVPFMNMARQAIAKKDMAAAAQIVEDHLGMSFKEFHKEFLPTKSPDGKILPPRFNLTEEFRVVPKNQLIGRMDNRLSQKYAKTYEDGTITGSMARQHQVQYTSERDVDTLKQIFNRGDKDNPVFTYEPAPFVDPVTSINRAMSRIINSQFMDDYKIFSVEHWLKEALGTADKPGYLKLAVDDNPNSVWRSPMWYFNNAKDKSAFVANTPPEIANRLLTERMQIQQFLGMPSNLDTMLHSASEKLSDAFYNKFGPSRLDPSWMLNKVNDPIRFLRAVTFHAKLGLFSVPQLLVQMNTWVNILAIAGVRNTAAGTTAAFLHQLTRINPNMIDHLDTLATKLRLPGLGYWKPGELKEAQEALGKTGFEHVGGEYQLRDDTMNPKIITSAGKRFLDWGTRFFTEGERQNRLAAWYTAYREFRDVNPTGRLTPSNLKTILERADLLTVNMSRASASTLHQGIFTIPTQFLSYQMRLAELFTGKRMGTGIEGALNRARMFSWYSAIYGLPTGFGLSGLPLGDYFRRSALDNNYVVGDNYLSSMFMEGIPALTLGLISGQGDIRKGTFYNIGNRYGVQGFQTLRDALRSDRTMWELIGGAAFSTIANTIENMDGFVNGMMSFLRDDDKYFPLKPEDFIDPLKEISSVNYAWRMMAAINTGRWLSKKGTYLDDTSPLAAVLQTVTGLQPQEIDDLQLQKWLHTNQLDYEKYIKSRAEEEFKKAIRARDDEPSQSTDYFKRALSWLNIGGYPQDKRPSFIAQASQDNETLINQMNWNFWKQASDADKPARWEALQDKMQMREMRGK